MSKNHISVYLAREEKGNGQQFSFANIGEPIKIAVIFNRELSVRGVYHIFRDNPRVEIIRSDTSFLHSIAFFKQQPAEKWPDVMLMSDDLAERKSDHLPMIEKFKALQPSIKIIVIGQYDNEDNDFRCWFKAGVKGYLSANTPKEEFEISITAVRNDCYCVRLVTVPLQVYKEIRKEAPIEDMFD